MTRLEEAWEYSQDELAYWIRESGIPESDQLASSSSSSLQQQQATSSSLTAAVAETLTTTTSEEKTQQQSSADAEHHSYQIQNQYQQARKMLTPKDCDALR